MAHPIDELRGAWSGAAVACIASGPSLVAEDCELIRQAGLRTIVVNTSFRLAPWAQALLAMDVLWWQNYHEELRLSGFAGLHLGPGCAGMRTIPIKGKLYPVGCGNSGSYAMSLAMFLGASKVIGIGYDCAKDGTRAHWHPDHPGKMGNARTLDRWPIQFDLIARYAKTHGVSIINCSRTTALKCFDKSPLEKELAAL